MARLANYMLYKGLSNFKYQSFDPHDIVEVNWMANSHTVCQQGAELNTSI